MAAYCLNTAPALEVAYTSTPGTITGYAVPAQLGQATWNFVVTTAAWVAQGIADTVFTANDVSFVFTATGHNLRTGLPVQVSNSGGALPTGLSAATNYWARVIDANTFYLYDTRAHALVGGATGQVQVSTNGTGTQTMTTVATAGAGSALIPADVLIPVDPALGAKVSVLQQASGGNASMWPASATR
jgi:hypothetical protein